MDFSAQLKAKDFWLGAAIVFAAAIFIAVPAWQLVVLGPFRWAVRTAAFQQGGLEALVLIALVATGFALNRRGWLLALVTLPAVLYLRRHAVDAALLVDVLYLELIIGLGMALRRFLRQTTPANMLDYVLAFVSGFSLWSVCAWTASALQLGSPRATLWLTALLAIPACFSGQRPLLLWLWQRVRVQSRNDRIWCGVLAAWILVLFARTRTVISFDGLWYGLRSPYVLVPGRSVYEALGLTSPVYYFPKIYEVFLLPLNALKDYAALEGFSILLLLLLLLVCRVVLREIGAPARAQLPLLALIATLPAAANFATDAKPDVIATLFVVSAALFGMLAVRGRARAAFAWVLACIALAGSAKITAIPYAGIVLLATMFASWISRNSAPVATTTTSMSPRLAWTTFALAASAAVFVATRTWLLTGVPTIGPDPLLKFWLALGFELKEPAGTLSWTRAQDWTDVPALLVDWLFRPQLLDHIVIGWTGNVWLWFCAITGLAAITGAQRTRAPAESTWPLIALIATGMALAIGNRYQVRGGDGNYFLFAVLPAIAYAGSAAFTRLTMRPRVFATTVACVAAFALFQATYSFASAGWVAGTRAFDFEFSKSPRATRRTRTAVLEQAGLSRIAGFLDELPHATRVSGITETTAQFWLPACFEDLQAVSYSRPEYVHDARSIRHFLHERRIDYFIMLREGIEMPRFVYISPAVAEAARELSALPGVRRIDDGRYYLLDLRLLAADMLDPSDEVGGVGASVIDPR